MNEYDEMFDEIISLSNMLNEITKDNFFSHSTRQLAMEFLIEETSHTHSVEDLLEYGFEGYTHFTDLNLIGEIKDTISCWCGEDQDHSIGDSAYLDIIKNEIKSEIDKLMTKAIEKHMLK